MISDETVLAFAVPHAALQSRLHRTQQGHTWKLQHCVFLLARRLEPWHYSLNIKCIVRCNSALHTGKKGNGVPYSLHCVLSGQSGFKEVSAMDEIMPYRVCQQHYLTSLSLISRAQGGAHLFVLQR